MLWFNFVLGLIFTFLPNSLYYTLPYPKTKESENKKQG